MISMPIFAVLAITSAQYFKRRTGFKNWKRLRRLISLPKLEGVILRSNDWKADVGAGGVPAFDSSAVVSCCESKPIEFIVEIVKV